MGVEGMSDKTTPLYVRIPVELHDRIKVMAEAEGRSMAGMCARILEVGVVHVSEYELKWVLK
jgi:predicted DNA-binding protein